MRIALVEIVGVLIKEIALETEEDGNGGGDEDGGGRSGKEGQERREKKISKLFDLLLERFCDVSSYVRIKVLQTISKLLECVLLLLFPPCVGGMLTVCSFCIRLRVKLPKQRALTTPYIIDALSDKASSVRRYAISTLTNMILTHPFGAMYGGFLNLPEWEGRYKGIKTEIKKLEAKGMEAQREVEPAENEVEGEEEEGEEEGEDENEEAKEDEDPDAEPSPKKKKKKSKPRTSTMPQAQPLEDTAEDIAAFTRLKLTKRYIADALEFIRSVESSMGVMGDLLGSTSKAEVLEAIEFFKVAHEYQMSGASVSSSPSIPICEMDPTLIAIQTINSLESRRCSISSGRKITVERRLKKTKSSRAFVHDSSNAIGHFISTPSRKLIQDNKLIG